MNLFDLLKNTAEKFPGKAAVIENENHYSYSQLVKSISNSSLKFEELGINNQKKIGLMFPNGANYIALFYAILKCDAIAVPISSDLRREDIRDLIDEMEIEHLIVHHDFTGLFDTGEIVFRGFNLTMEGNDEVTAAHAAVSAPQKSSDLKNLKGIHVANIRFTSGTTSKSKGVVLSHETIYKRMLATNSFFKINENDTIIWTLSMAHHFAATICCHLSVGATIVVGGSVLPDVLFDVIKKHNGTVMYATPMIYKMLSRLKEKKLPHSLRFCVSTAMGLHKSIAEDFYNKFNFSLTNAYGLIEVGIPIVNSIGNPGIESVGRPVPDFEIRILDDNNNDLGIGEVGRLAVKGPGMLDAYCKPWRSRDDILYEGWFISGDLAKIDDVGFVYIIGRDSDIINVGGMKVFPYEVEDILSAHPGIKEAMVTGEPDQRFGQAVKATIVPAEDVVLSIKDVTSFCEDRISFFKVPKKIEFVKSLPKTATGKIMRRKIT